MMTNVFFGVPLARVEPGDWDWTAFGDVATWAGAAATSGALWLAILGLRNERRHRIAAENAATERAHRSQAEAVFAWYAGFTPGTEPAPVGGYDSLIVRNDSNLPVYDAVVSLVLVQGAGARTSEQLAEHPHLRYTLRKETFVIPPGTWRFRIVEGWRGMSSRAGAEVAFRDVRGSSWVRRADGALEELQERPFELLNVSRPISDYELEPVFYPPVTVP